MTAQQLAQMLIDADGWHPSPGRDTLLLEAVALARRLGLNAGITVDPERPDTPIAVIELPGRNQISWQLGPYREAVERLGPGEQAARIEAYARTAGAK